MQALVRWLLLIALVATGLLKLISGYGASVTIPEWLYYSAALVEVGLAGLLMLRCDIVAASGVLLLSCTGVFLALRSPQTGCGCLGPGIALDPRHHLIFAGAFGAVAALLLSLEFGRRRLQHEQRVHSA